LSEAAIKRFGKGEYRVALRQLGQSLFEGDDLRHWLSSFKRGMYAMGQKYF
jgi:hypothetical protein